MYSVKRTNYAFFNSSKKSNSKEIVVNDPWKLRVSENQQAEEQYARKHPSAVTSPTMKAKVEDKVVLQSTFNWELNGLNHVSSQFEEEYAEKHPSAVSGPTMKLG